MTKERITGRSSAGCECWVVSLGGQAVGGGETVLGRGTEELGRESWKGRGRGEIVGQEVLQHVGVEGFSSHQPIVQGEGLHDLHGGEHVVLETVKAELLQARGQAGSQEGGQITG